MMKKDIDIAPGDVRVKKLQRSSNLKDSVYIILGVLSACLGLKAFLLPNHFLDGGVTGISLLTNFLTGVDLSLLIVLINIPFIIIGAKQISVKFAVKTIIAIALLALSLKFINFPILTEDKLLISVFGGVFLGGGIGMAIRGGCVIDGTEVLGIFISRRSSFSVGDFIAIFNVVLFLIASQVVSLETALYSILTYVSASKTVDFIIHGIEEYTGVTIVSNYAEEIKETIQMNLGRGVTVYKGEVGFGQKDNEDLERRILFCVITRLEVAKLLFEIEKIDPHAFVLQQTVDNIKGGIVKRRPLMG